MWITIPADKLAQVISGPEVDAAKSAALAEGQSDPVPDIIEAAVNRVRGKVAVRYRLGAAGTVPAQLVSTTLIIIRIEALSRLPVDDLVNEARKMLFHDAIKTLDDVAAGRFLIEEPGIDEVAPENMATPSPAFGRRNLHLQMHQTDGL
jgi:hypothetical protein